MVWRWVSHRERDDSRECFEPLPRTPELVGPAVCLRYLRLEDAAPILTLLGDPEVSRFFLWEPPHDLAAAREYVRGFQHEVSQGWAYHFAVESREGDAELLGVANLYHINSMAGEAEIGIWLGRPYWGRGFQQEVCELLLRLGLRTLKLRRILFQVAVGNDRAHAAFHKLGAVECGRAWLVSQRQELRVEHRVLVVERRRWSSAISGRVPTRVPAKRVDR